MTEPYNPLDKVHLGQSVAEALLNVDVRPLTPTDTEHLRGAGVYALYYIGSFPPYSRVADANSDEKYGQPIYVGKAIPQGGRKGGLTTDSGTGLSLRNRLREHAGSIGEVDNLTLSDFAYRSLVVDDIWIPLGENVLIERFKPLWNTLIDGFGNKTPGAGRSAQARSSWDVLHPGRRYVGRLSLGPGRYTEAEIIARIDAVYQGAKPRPLDGGDVET